MGFGGLRNEISKNCSGEVFFANRIHLLKESNYYIQDIPLSGDAPKQMISAYFFEAKSKIRKCNPKSWKQFICKTAEKWYPVESITEFIINKIGDELGLKMNKFRLVIANKQIRFLSEYFLSKDEKLIHAAEICGEYINDMLYADKIANDRIESKKLFTYEFICEAIRNVFPNHFDYIQENLIKIIVFDAIVGNNDRHFYNWGVISHLKKSNNSLTFAPIYDSARGLLWNIPDKDLPKFIENEKRVKKYIQNSTPRISLEENKSSNHFDLVEFIIRNNNEYRSIVQQLTDREKERKVITKLEQGCFPLLSEQRKLIIRTLLSKRFQKLREICG